MGLNATGVKSAKVTVTTAGTRVQLSSSPIAVSWIWITTPASGNTGDIYVGGNDVSSSNGFNLAAGGGANGRIKLDASTLGMSGEELRLDLIYVDGATSGNFVNILYDAKVSL